MIFNSLPFLSFFIIIFLMYYVVLKGNVKAQNLLLFISSYAFYGYVNWKMVPLLLSVTIIIFFLGKLIHKTTDYKKSSFYTTLGVLFAVGLLVYFKYVNFFIDSFTSFLNHIGLKTESWTYTIIVPLGISYFSFKLISYIIEIHRKKIEPSTDFITFSTYIAFFPTLLSGPIDNPSFFIPQLQKKRSFDYSLVVDGCRQILWGLFQKLVIADNLSLVIHEIWSDIPNQSGSTLMFTAMLFSVQLYTDFSGYSNIAIGLGKTLGFHITKNFDYPFFSRNISEFWRKWHISLTSWLTNYIFIPLNIKFRDLGTLGIILAIMVNMLVVGIWHGANWTFVIFGLYNGLIFIPIILSGAFLKRKKNKRTKFGLPTLGDFFKMIRTFLLITLGLIFFRAEHLPDAWLYLRGVFNTSLLSLDVVQDVIIKTITPLSFALLMFVIEWFYRDTSYPLTRFGIKWVRPLRWSLYSFIIFVVIVFMQTEETPFIYSQF
ncbi:MBOAT family O-acyltransferase [Dokdonia ponticola]|uniref:MBOAT family O-acyltransferase n=1 Tax=Dokdonia ponticola TaxID=2041041 RepID=A0ABV9HQS0_9FLAO